VRLRLTLLVAATTSLVLVAFLVPLAVLVGRVAASNAISEATARSQVIVSSVSSGAGRLELLALRRSLARDGYRVRVRSVAESSVPRSTVVRTEGGGARLVQPVVVEDQTYVVQTDIPRRLMREGVARARLVLLGLGLVLIALSLAVADRLARALTRPISEQATVAHRLAAGDLSARVRPGGPEEVRAVGVALNLLAARIGELLAHERESVADLSHRLRTPITALRLGVDSLPDGPDRDALRGSVDELTRQVDALIQEARRTEREGVAARCDAREVVAERVAFWQPLAEDQARELLCDLPAGLLAVRASASDLEAALDALLGNVFAHTPEGGALQVRLRAVEGAAVLEVIDEGPGFPDLSVLERGDSRGGSTGLGLDIVRRTALASGGDLELLNRPGGGAIARLRLGTADSPAR
jgi:signal transduction histidine kinase